MLDASVCQDCGYTDFENYQAYFCPYCMRQYKNLNNKFVFIMSDKNGRDD